MACPTGTMAGQLYDDLVPVPAGRRGRAVPGVGDAAVRAGQPARRDDGPPPRGAVAAARPRAHARRSIVTGVRALLQRLGPGRHRRSSRSASRPGDVLDPDELVRPLVEFGYRREELVEHRGEVARRGAIIDVFPSTADAPIRIDLWGDEVDRLTDVQRQRPAQHRRPGRGAHLPGPRAAPERRGAGPGRRSWSADRAVGPRAVGAPGRGHAVRRHGELAAVARPTASSCSPTCSPTRPRSCSSSRGGCATGPRPARRGGRPRPRAGQHVGARPRQRRSRGCTPSPTGCSPAATALWTIDSTPGVARRAGRAGVAGGARSSATARGSSPA